MQSVNKYSSNNRIGLGWTMGGAVLAIVVAAIGLLLALSNHRLSTRAPAAPASNVQPAASARAQTQVEVMRSGQYPFGASGFGSLLSHTSGIAHAQTLADITRSGQYPFGASGFDGLLAHTSGAAHAQTLADVTRSGQYPFGASGFDSLPQREPTTAQTQTLANIIGSGQYPFGATGFDSLLAGER